MSHAGAVVRNWIHLRPGDGVDDVHVTTDDGDRFVLSLDEAIAACRHGDQARKFIDQVNEVFARLDCWIDRHAGRIDRAYLHIGRDGLDLVVVQRSRSLDVGLQDSLTELDLEVAGDEALDLIRLDVTTLPYCSEDAVASFVPMAGTRVRRGVA